MDSLYIALLKSLRTNSDSAMQKALDTYRTDILRGHDQTTKITNASLRNAVRISFSVAVRGTPRIA